MTIPTVSNFPKSFDNDQNLFLVHDSLRMRLLTDYNPGDLSILVEGDEKIMLKFPPTGIITLTEQCSEIDYRALSFYYGSRTSTSFDDLELLPEFKNFDCVKPKKITNVTMNVIDKHHNHLKDTLISIEENLGTKYTKDKETITGRIKYLENLVFQPKAWFSANITVGLAPLTVTFDNQSVRLGDGWIKETWDFGEEDVDPIEIESSNFEEYQTKDFTTYGVVVKGTKLTKTYATPGLYTVKLKMENEYGPICESGSSCEVELENLINVKIDCPEQADITINYRASQNFTNGDPPKIRSLANTFIDLEVKNGENPANLGYSYGGELLDSGGSPIDPIVEYTWNLDDDLQHVNSNITKASYGIGGYYDIILRVDTQFGSYRITQYENSIDIVEAVNLWSFNFTTANADGSGIVKAFEFGLISETFKTLGNQTLSLNRNNSFLSQPPLSYDSTSYYEGTYNMAKKEFEKNVEFVPFGTNSSGNKGNSLLFWASGGAVVDDKQILMKKYNAFDDVYTSLSSLSNRPWNWTALNSSSKIHLLFGQDTIVSNQNQALPERVDFDLATLTASAPLILDSSSFENGADELLDHSSLYESGVATNGYFAVYRTAWKDSIGYILRNSAVNEFFRLSSFYKTKGTTTNNFATITKLQDMIGSVKVEGQLVTLYNGIFMFNNSGEICAWNDTSLTWEVGRANSSSLSFRSVQDTSQSGFDEKSNTLLATSDGDRVAYLSFDYSEKAFIKFNATDLTFSTTKYRPPGKQFKMGVY